VVDEAISEKSKGIERRRIQGLSLRFCKLLTKFVLVCLLSPVLTTESWAGPLETIQTKIAQFLKRPGVRSAQWGIQVMEPATDKVLVEVNPDKTFLPASVLKVVTTSTALEKLGADFKFRTGVYTNGTLEPDGTITRDLILVGRGDSNLTDPYGELLEKPAFRELAEKLHSAGIRKIKGDVVGDDSYFDLRSYGTGWTEKDLKSVYGAPINALSIHNNVMWIHIRPGQRNKLVSYELEPHTSYFRVRNLGITGSKRSRRTLNARLIPGSRTIVVSGVLPLTQNYSQYVLLERPAELAATLLKEELERHGITVRGGISTLHYGEVSKEEQTSWNLLAEHQSPPLIHALQIINKRSQNLHAEMLLRTLGAEFKGTGTNEAGLEVVKEFLLEAGIDDEKIRLNDGCGLSRENLITPRFQTSLLQFLSKRPYFDLFLNTLAISGTDGTLRNRLSANEVRGSIHAKTGTLNGVTTLSGYITTKSGRNLVFSIFANRVNATTRVKKTIDEICSLFVNLY
jgi:serine-type D-Ala-D-Ala carboxypeptidase/endopeptidase (penicillin-binding protein 4)